MDFSGLVELGTAFGPPGLIIAYLLWQQDRIDKRWLAHEGRRADQDAARIDADKEMVAALTALKVMIEARHAR